MLPKINLSQGVMSDNVGRPRRIITILMRDGIIYYVVMVCK